MESRIILEQMQNTEVQEPAIESLVQDLRYPYKKYITPKGLLAKIPSQVSAKP